MISAIAKVAIKTNYNELTDGKSLIKIVTIYHEYTSKLKIVKIDLFNVKE